MLFIKYYITFFLLIGFLYGEKHLLLLEKLQKVVFNIQRAELVYIDNNFIQTYKNDIGIWKKISNKQQIDELAKYYHTTIEAIKKMSDKQENIDDIWIFIPYNEKMIASIQSLGMRRRSIFIDKNQLLWPIEGRPMTNKIVQGFFKPLHRGIDIAVRTGAPVLAAHDGTIIKIENNIGGHGNSILIQHPSGYTTHYAHLQTSSLIPIGTKVKKGQTIAFSGNSGDSTGPHLHFEIQVNGIILNPEKFLSSTESIMNHQYQ